MNATILCIEGKYSGTRVFADRLQKKGYHVAVVRTGKAALASLDDITPHVAVVNAPSMRTTGVRICKSLHERSNGLPIILISKDKIKADQVDANVVLELPFTVRKLNNRIKPLLPIQSKNCLKVGKIQLDLERNQVHFQGRKETLTPKLTALLKLLMENAGDVVERNELFCEVWNTDFTDDTRTLDVHISWLRKAIEEDSQNPEYLKTQRGVGYCLDV